MVLPDAVFPQTLCRSLLVAEEAVAELVPGALGAGMGLSEQEESVEEGELAGRPRQVWVAVEVAR